MQFALPELAKFLQGPAQWPKTPFLSWRHQNLERAGFCEKVPIFWFPEFPAIPRDSSRSPIPPAKRIRWFSLLRSISAKGPAAPRTDFGVFHFMQARPRFSAILRDSLRRCEPPFPSWEMIGFCSSSDNTNELQASCTRLSFSPPARQLFDYSLCCFFTRS